jgi:hypothetical protein
MSPAPYLVDPENNKTRIIPDENRHRLRIPAEADQGSWMIPITIPA